MSSDDIIDAEWEDAPNDRPAQQSGKLTHHRRKPSHRSPPPQPDSAPSPWQNRAFWHETVGTILTVVGRIGVIALGLIVLFFLAIAWADHNGSGASGFNDAAAGSQSPVEQSIDAKQMLQDWSRAVTGRSASSGFTLVNGSGKPGEFCNNASGDTLLKFGGEHMADANVYDFYARYHGATDSGIMGAFWFDPTDGSLLTRNQAMVDSKGKRGKSVPDLARDVAFDGEGRAIIDDVAYHVCTL